MMNTIDWQTQDTYFTNMDSQYPYDGTLPVILGYSGKVINLKQKISARVLALAQNNSK